MQDFDIYLDGVLLDRRPNLYGFIPFVIYPNIKPFPLTALPDLKDTLPSVHAKLKDGREWTVEAEAEFLRLML